MQEADLENQIRGNNKIPSLYTRYNYILSVLAFHKNKDSGEL